MRLVDPKDLCTCGLITRMCSRVWGCVRPVLVRFAFVTAGTMGRPQGRSQTGTRDSGLVAWLRLRTYHSSPRMAYEACPSGCICCGCALDSGRGLRGSPMSPLPSRAIPLAPPLCCPAQSATTYRWAPQGNPLGWPRKPLATPRKTTREILLTG